MPDVFTGSEMRDPARPSEPERQLPGEDIVTQKRTQNLGERAIPVDHLSCDQG
jgi:hypothetical protein